MFWTIAFDVVVVALLLFRQRRIRPVPRTLRLRMPIFLGVIGLIEVLAYTGSHHVSSSGLWLVLGVTVVGAAVLGFVRALTVQIWESNHWVVRQATGLTMILWVLSLVLHLAIGSGTGQVATAHLETASFLLYVALTLAAQAYVVHVRAAPLWRAPRPRGRTAAPVRLRERAGRCGRLLHQLRRCRWARWTRWAIRERTTE